MSKKANVIRYYGLCNRLKNTVRTGWIMWNIKKERVESVAEHIYSVQMLALAMYSEYQYDIDIQKVIMMIAVHELEEILIGDIAATAKEHETKEVIGHQAVSQILSVLIEKEKIESLILEFDERKTKEAKFVYHCDKLDCDLQAKIYSEEGSIDLTNQQENEEFFSDSVQERIQSGCKTFADIWFAGDKFLYEDDENFMEVFEYAQNHSILEEE